jgi:hypothetical protein
MKPNPYISLLIKINSKGIEDLTVRPETIEEHIREMLTDTPKAQKTAKNRQNGLHKASA